MYWWLTKTWETVNEEGRVGWIPRRRKQICNSRGREERCCINTTYSECTDGSEGSGSLWAESRVTLARPLLSLSGPRLLVRASVLMRAKAKGATQRNVHTATMRLTDSSLQADGGDGLVFRPSGSINTQRPRWEAGPSALRYLPRIRFIFISVLKTLYPYVLKIKSGRRWWWNNFDTFSSLTVNWILLGCGQNKTLDDVSSGFGKHWSAFYRPTNRSID